MVRFQMKTSNRPQTIAVVRSEVDIKSFRDNPEWYELKEVTPEETVKKPAKVSNKSKVNKDIKV